MSKFMISTLLWGALLIVPVHLFAHFVGEFSGQLEMYQANAPTHR